MDIFDEIYLESLGGDEQLLLQSCFARAADALPASHAALKGRVPSHRTSLASANGPGRGQFSARAPGAERQQIRQSVRGPPHTPVSGSQRFFRMSLFHSNLQIIACRLCSASTTVTILPRHHARFALCCRALMAPLGLTRSCLQLLHAPRAKASCRALMAAAPILAWRPPSFQRRLIPESR